MMMDMTQVGSMMAAVMFLCAILQQVFQQQLSGLVEHYFYRLKRYCSPYIHINFPKFQDEELLKSTAYIAIEMYLTTIPTNRAKHQKAKVTANLKNVFYSMDDYEEVFDEFKGIKIWWSSRKIFPQQQTLLLNARDDYARWFYKLTFHKKHEDFVKKQYLDHVFKEGTAISQKERQRRLYTNNFGSNTYSGREQMWSHVIFDHPSTFDTLAMDPNKKKDIVDDLEAFSESEEYYKSVGRVWKRGYLLYGPPGTGKSSMIAAMANFLKYDIYDIELSSVKNNANLKKLLIDTSSKSIIVIEDIDCSLDLTGKRKKKKDTISEKFNDNKKKTSKMTLSGLLNSVDGLWSVCTSEKLIVFTTNHIDQLDPALIRSGRMDFHIEMSYCCFETFKDLAKTYLKVESHELFAPIGQLLKETNITPADVAEKLMRKSVRVKQNADTCLNSLIRCLVDAKEEARQEAMKEASKLSIENVEKVQDDVEVLKKSSNESDEESSEEDSSDSDG